MNNRDRILEALDRAEDIAGFDAGNLRAPEMQTMYYLQMAQIHAIMELTDVFEMPIDLQGQDLSEESKTVVDKSKATKSTTRKSK